MNQTQQQYTYYTNPSNLFQIIEYTQKSTDNKLFSFPVEQKDRGDFVWETFSVIGEYKAKMQPRYLRFYRVRYLEHVYGTDSIFLKYYLRIKQNVKDPASVLHHMRGR